MRKFLILLLFTLPVHAKVTYKYQDRDHTKGESLAHLGVLYTLGWGVYYITQTETFNDEGSFDNFKDNFGKIVFDKDEPIWNWVGHPYTGSHFYLYYRANGYSQINSFKMAFLQSALFEVLTEIYTEPISVQDLFLTPTLGSVLGLGLEKVSLFLLNKDNIFARALGHFLNPATMFWFYEGKVVVTPTVSKNTWGMQLNASF